MQWHRQGMMLRLSVNLSVQQLQHDSWLSIVEEALAASGLPPQYLDLEITESVIITHPEKAVATLVKLKQMGVSITVDDFGTGYSSLSYLARLPIQAVKIDQRFVHGLEQNRNDEAITQAIIALSHSLGLRVHRRRRGDRGAVRVPEAPRLRGSAGLPHRAPARGAGSCATGGACRKRRTGSSAGRATCGSRPAEPRPVARGSRPARSRARIAREIRRRIDVAQDAGIVDVDAHQRSRCAATTAFAPSSPVSAASAA